MGSNGKCVKKDKNRYPVRSLSRFKQRQPVGTLLLRFFNGLLGFKLLHTASAGMVNCNFNPIAGWVVIN
jgi:hypothetical protein